MTRGPGRPPAWIRVLLVAIPGLLAVSGCESILEQLPGDDAAGRRSPAALPVLSIAAAPPVEEGGDLLFAVTLSRASDVSVTARYRTEDGTARSGTDFQPAASGQVTLTPGAREQVIVVRTLSDEVGEGSETFIVRLTGVTNATLGTATATGTILGDDDTQARAIPVTAGVYRSGRLETGDDVDYFRVVVRASAAVIAATDRGRAADSDNNVRDTVVRIEHDGRSGRFAPLEVDAHHVDGALVTVGESGSANVYIRVSSDVATPYDLAVWVIDRQAVPWFLGDVADPSFDIELRYVGAEPTAAQKAIIRQAADVWERVITDGVPDRVIDSSSVICDDGDPSLFGAHVDDLVVYIKVGAIDGRGGTLAQAGPCWTRLPSRLPYLGIVILDSADLTPLHNTGVLRRIVTHEIGHALGFGTSWDQMAGPHGLPLLRQPSLDPDGAVVPGRDTYFSGRAAVAAFDAAGGHAYRRGAKVPVENDTGQYRAGTLDAHWRESVFDAELMTSSQLMERGTNEPLSRVTVAALYDMGYKVDYDAAEPYTLPVSARAAARRSAHAEADVYDLSGDVRQAPVMAEDPLAVPRVRLSR